ncbi:hypothetical protein CHISP_0769 [Chitinispirillum alkaliphilum]|nr:hypothetical protein CHISP_0769 [Chitinispirillum alkaliphilum]
MENILNKNILNIIKEYPEIEKVLLNYDIGCTTCSIGTCKFKDIISIHNLSIEQETALLEAVAQIIYPGEKVIISRIERVEVSDKGTVPPIRDLVEEHKLIKKVIAMIPVLLNKVDLNSRDNRDLYSSVLEFISNYADAFHHEKEEKILFGYFDQNSDILSTFLKEHEIGRNHVREAKRGVSNGNMNLLKEHLTAYTQLLKEHIKKEDEILFPWMNRNLTDSQIGQLFAKFTRTDKSFENVISVQKSFVERITKLLNFSADGDV